MVEKDPEKSMFSEEFKNEISRMIDKKFINEYKDIINLKIKKNEETFNKVQKMLMDHDILISKLELKNDSLIEDVNKLKELNIDNIKKELNIREEIAKILLELIPNFNLRISNEIKSHLFAISDFLKKL